MEHTYIYQCMTISFIWLTLKTNSTRCNLPHSVDLSLAFFWHNPDTKEGEESKIAFHYILYKNKIQLATYTTKKTSWFLPGKFACNFERWLSKIDNRLCNFRSSICRYLFDLTCLERNKMKSRSLSHLVVNFSSLVRCRFWIINIL